VAHVALFSTVGEAEKIHMIIIIIANRTLATLMAFGAPREVFNPPRKNSEIQLRGVHLANHGQLKSVSQDKQILFTVRPFNHLKK